MTSASNRRTATIAAILAVLVLLVGAGVWWTSTSGPSPTSPPSEARLDGDWSPSEGRTVEIGLDPSRGPIWRRTDAGDPEGGVPVTPRLADVTAKWRTAETPSGHRMVGRAELGAATVTYRWTFLEGDPQARLSVRVTDIPLERLRSDDLRTTLRLPTGSLRTLDRRLKQIEAPDEPLDLGAWTPFGLSWRGPNRALTLAHWNGDGARVRGVDGGGFGIDLYLWRRKRHPALGACELTKQTDTGLPTVDLQASLTVTFGTAPVVVPWRLPANRVAAITPIFDTPESHPDTTLHRTRPDDPQDWRARAATLAYGHSNSEDPRYGNGGLLGHGLGGTVAAPAKWAESTALGAFRDDIVDTRFDMALRDGGLLHSDKRMPPEGHDGLDCRTLIAGEESTAGVVATEFEPHRQNLETSSFYSPFGPVATSVAPSRLDGTRSELTTEVLSRKSIEGALRRRTVAAISTPLIGSRDPTIPAAREALLSPERNGEWTLTSPFATALATLELVRERHPVLVTSLSDAASYWRGARQSLQRWTPEGDLLVRNTTEKPIEGYTIVLGGAHVSDDELTLSANRAPSSGADADSARRREPTLAVAHRNGPAGNSPPRTWISWNLQTDTTYRLDLGAATEDLPLPSPVDWQLVR